MLYEKAHAPDNPLDPHHFAVFRESFEASFWAKKIRLYILGRMETVFRETEEKAEESTRGIF